MEIALTKNNLSWLSILKSEGFKFNTKDNDIYECNTIIINNKVNFEKLLANINNSKKALILDESIEVNYSKLKLFKTISTKYSTINFNYVMDENIDSLKIKIYKYKKSIIIFYKNNLSEKLSDDTQSYKKINLNNSDSFIETLSTVNKKNIREYCLLILKECSNYLNIPLITIWRFPKKYKNVFNFRIDIDPENRATKEVALKNIHNTIELCKEHKNKISFAVNLSRFSKEKKFLKKYITNDFDFHSHNFYHCLFFNKSINKYNILKADNYLNELGIKNFGFFSPEYYWYNNSAQIFDDLNYPFASSFGFDHNNYSYYPIIKNKIMNYLEVPYNSINFGLIKRDVTKDIEEIFKVFKNSIIANYYKYITPCFFYDHPTNIGKNISYFSDLLKFVEEVDDLFPITISNWVKWFKKKEEVLMNLIFSYNQLNNQLKLNLLKKNSYFDDYSVAVYWPNRNNVELYDLKENIEILPDKGKKIETKINQYNSSINYNNEKTINIWNNRRHRKKNINNLLMLLYRKK